MTYAKVEIGVRAGGFFVSGHSRPSLACRADAADTMPVLRRAAVLGSLGLLSWSSTAFIQAPHAWVRPLSQPGKGGESRRARTQDVHTFSKPAARRSRLFADSDGASSPGQIPEVIFEPDVPYGDQQAEIEYFGDDELLEKYRQDRQKVNDQVGAQRTFAPPAQAWLRGLDVEK